MGVASSADQTASRLILLGGSSAGKSTILYQLLLGERVNTIPTIGCNVETIIFFKTSSSTSATATVSTVSQGTRNSSNGSGQGKEVWSWPWSSPRAIIPLLSSLATKTRTYAVWEIPEHRGGVVAWARDYVEQPRWLPSTSSETTATRIGDQEQRRAQSEKKPLPPPVPAVIFVVDSAEHDPSWNQDTKSCFWTTMSLDGFTTNIAVGTGNNNNSDNTTASPRLPIGITPNAPVLVFANKQDQRHAMTVGEVRDWLELPRLNAARGSDDHDSSGNHHRHEWHIQGCNALTGEGLQEGIDWLMERLSV